MKILYKLILLFIFLFSASSIFAQTSEGEKGIEFYNQGEYQKAVETLQKVVETNPENRILRLYLGMSKARLKYDSEAIKDFHIAEKLRPKGKFPEEPETRINMKSRLQVGYTDSARMNGTQGTIKMAIEFGADGKIKMVYPFQTLAFGLTENTVTAAGKIIFEPAVKNGKACSSIEIVSYSFTMY